jgi:IS4 transposase
VEPVGPGEGELTASLRLVKWLWKNFKHFADVVVVDAGFPRAPFINSLLKRGIHVVIRLKDERMHIMQDARGLYNQREPDEEWTERESNRETKVLLWDEEGLESWEGVKEPLRVVRIIEEKRYNQIRGGQRIEVREQREIIVGASLPKQQAPPQVVREIIHRRWDIENPGFHELKGNWHLNHCYVHQEVAIQAVLWLMLLAVNLFWLFLYRNRRSFATSGYSQREVAELLRNELFFSNHPLWRYLWNTS